MSITRSFLDDQISQLLSPVKLQGNVTLSAAHFYSLNTLDGQSIQTVTIPLDLDRSAFRVGGMASFFNINGLQNIFAPVAGVTINGASSNITLAASFTNGIIILTRVSDNEYLLQVAGAGAAGGQVNTIVAGANITVDATDPVNPIVSASGAGAFKGALVVRPNSQGISNGVPTALTQYITEIYDTDSFHDNSVNPSRMTIPAGVSRVKLFAVVPWEGNATGFRSVTIRINGATDRGEVVRSIVGSTDEIMQVETPVIDVVENDFFEVMVTQNSGVTLFVLGSGGIGQGAYGIEVIE